MAVIWGAFVSAVLFRLGFSIFPYKFLCLFAVSSKYIVRIHDGPGTKGEWDYVDPGFYFADV